MPSNLIDLLHARKSTKTPFGYGLCTADRYVKRVLAECPQAVSDGESMLKEACKIPTYSNEDMVLEKAMSVGSFKDLVPDGVVIPKNTLMVIRHVMTTTKEDRDHDILETAGAELDPRSPLLWQHIHTLPIGKLLAKIDHTKDMLRVVVALLDMNELTEDCAKLFEADALRFSHGFQVPQDGFEERKEQNGGFRITKYSIFEDSAVSVPSNTDAIPDAIATQKFTSAIGKAFANSLLGERKTQVRGADVQELEKLAQKELFQETSPDGEWTVTTSFKPTKKASFSRPAIDSVDRHEHPASKSFIRTKGFSVESEQLEASKLEYDWASRFLGCEIKDLVVVGTFVPNIRMGTYFTGEQYMKTAEGYEKVDQRRLTRDGKEEPLLHETIQLNSKSSGTFMVEGLEFWKKSGGDGLVVKHQESYGGNYVVTYSKDESGSQFVDKCWDWARENNFLKGEAFSLTGTFLGREGTKQSDIFLEPENSKVLSSTIKKLGGKDFASRGIIMMGAPGTGKTLSCRAVKNETESTYIWVSARDFWRTGAVGGICSAFDMAKELAPAVIVFEDVDNWINSHSVDLMKTEMDGVDEHRGVFTILTTNYPDLIPPELIDRPGRFHDICEYHLPSKNVRLRMLRAWAAPDMDEKDLLSLVEKTDTYSGAHIFELCKYAATLQEEDESLDIKSALVQAIDKIDSQRSLIDQSQLAGSRYRPQRREYEPHEKAFGGKYDEYLAKLEARIDGDVESESTKAGRVLSAANVKKLKDVRSDMEEIDGMLESRSGKALCKSCMEKLDSVIKAAEPKPESKPGDEDKPEPMADDEKPKSFDDVAAALLMEGTPEQLSRLQRAVEAIQYTAELDAKAKQYRAFTSAT